MSLYPSHAAHTPISPSNSSSNLQLIIDALANYAKTTGIDLSKNPFANKLRLAKTPDDILQLLQEREKAFKEYRSRNRTLINCLSPAVKVLHAFSSTLGEAVSLVSHPSLVLLHISLWTLQLTHSGFPSHQRKLSSLALILSWL